MLRRSLLTLALPTAILLPAAAVAAPAAVSGSRTDPKGDTSSDGDLVRASAKYKASGALSTKIVMASYAEAAAHETVIGAFFAKRAGGKCDTTSGSALSFETDTKIAEAGLLPGHGPPAKSVPAKGSVKGNTVTLDVNGSRFANRSYNCVVVASLVTKDGVTKGIDRINIRLKR